MVDLLFDKFSTISKFFIFWTVQEGPGRLSGPSWEGLGGSWGGPGESGERLERLFGARGAVLEAILQQDDF